MTPDGKKMLRNFIDYCAEKTGAKAAVA
jgi:hypothetical protein